MDRSSRRLRYALVGTGWRARLFVRAIVHAHAGTAELVALADTNQTRMDTHNRWITELGARPVATYHAADFVAMLDKERVDVVVVTTIDRTHDEYIVAALDGGCDVITEKPLTVDLPRCRRIRDAVRRTGRRVTVAFNYRYRPVHEMVRKLLAAGEIGEVGSVHFEWLLDVRHGADYFRRWHRDRANSGGLLVHKACHHFDLITWWLSTRPVVVHAMGRRFFYGTGGRGAPGGPGRFGIDLAADERLSALYLHAAHEDGYRRDADVFSPGVTIEDDMAVLVGYACGATMTYHLTAYAPWEGYRVAFNGSRGRLELEVTESGAPGGGRHARLLVRPFWEPPRMVPVDPGGAAGHGGADARMAAALFGADAGGDPMRRAATERDGLLAVLTGVAANSSIETGNPVRISDLLDVDG